MTPDALARLHVAAFKQGRPWSAGEFDELLAQPHTHLSTRDHGFALWRAVAGEAELLTIAVDPRHQRQGIGRALMQDWTAAAARLADTAFLEVAADNAAAIALYRDIGFAPVATRLGYYQRSSGGAVDALVMQAALPLGQAGESGGPLPESG